MSPNRLLGVVESTAVVSAVCLFLATILGSVSLFFTVEAQVASYELRFLGLRVLLSSASGSVNVCGDGSVDVHMISSLRGSMLVVSPIVVSSLVVVPPIILFRGKLECLEESLMCLGELGCRLPFEMGFASLFFPLFEGPGDICSRVKVGGINDGASESFGHSVLQSFDGSLVI